MIDLELAKAISTLRAHCNREISRVNQEGAAQPISFNRFNDLLKSCDKVFVAADKIDPGRPVPPHGSGP